MFLSAIILYEESYCPCFFHWLSEAQDDSLAERFSNFGDQITEFSKNVAEKAKTHFDTITTSEFAENTR